MTDPIDVPYLELLFGGRQIPELNRDLIDVSITEALGMSSQFTLKVYTWDMDAIELTWIDHPVVALGTEVEISLGYVDALRPMILGEILDLDLEYSADAPFTLTITGQDLRHRMGRGEVTAMYQKVTDSAIIQKLAQKYGLGYEGDDTKTEHGWVAQRNLSDLAFANLRAQASGRELTMDGKTLIFKALDTSGEADVTLSPGTGLTAFSAMVSSSGRVGKVIVKTGDTWRKTALMGQATVPKFSSGILSEDNVYPDITKTVIKAALETQEEVDTAALVEASELAARYLTAHGACFGNTLVRPGAVVQIDGVGKRFSQKYVVTKATHTFSVSGGYRTSFELRGNVCRI
jgi:phage protein D